MSLVQNFPFFSIILAMFSGILSSVLDGKKARNVSLAAIVMTTVMSVAVLHFWDIFRLPGAMRSGPGCWRD